MVRIASTSVGKACRLRRAKALQKQDPLHVYVTTKPANRIGTYEAEWLRLLLAMGLITQLQAEKAQKRADDRREKLDG